MRVSPDEHVVLRACESSGLSRHELSELLQEASCTPYLLGRDIDAGRDWLTELRREGKRRREQDFEAFAASVVTYHRIAVRNLFESGPAAMAELGEERLLALTAPPVRKLVVGYEIRQGGALFLGPTGAGKSTGCAALGHRILQQARDRSISEQAPKRHYAGYNAGSLIWWARANDLANARARHELGSEAPAIIAAKHPKLLILDDLGWDLGRDGTISEVIAERYDAGKVTIATSGFRFEQLVERYGEATIRKILESGGVKGKIVSLFPSAAKGEPCA